MRVLFLTPLAPHPAVSGGQKVTLALLEAYSRMADVHLVGFYDRRPGPQSASIRDGLGHLCDRIDVFPLAIHYRQHRLRHIMLAARSVFGRIPFRLLKFEDLALRSLLAGLDERSYDLVHCDFLHMSGYLKQLLGLPVILAEHNVEWEIFDRHALFSSNPLVRVFSRREATRLRRFERDHLNRVNHVLTLSERDSAALVSSGVTTEMTVMPYPVSPVTLPTVREAESHSIISLGNLGAPGRIQGTLWFGREVWPRVIKRIPTASWHIVGTGGGREIEPLRALNGVHVHGFLDNPKLERLLRSTRVCVVPLFIGGGIRIKILDMLGLGIPCVATAVGVQGLTDAGVLVADKPEEFADRVCRLLLETDEWKQASVRGLEYVQAHHSAEALEWRFKRVVQSVLGRSSPFVRSNII